MECFANCFRLRLGRPLSSVNPVVRLALFCLILGTLSGPSSAQNTKGLPEVGSGSAPVSSLMLIDATQFIAGTDMCGAIVAACAKLGSSGYPAGGTIDARGFTGDKVCTGNNPTQMLNGCVANGGKLLLGTVHIYADGPTGGINGHYDDGTVPVSARLRSSFQTSFGGSKV